VKKLLIIAFLIGMLMVPVVPYSQSRDAGAQPPPISQTLVREGDFAIKLADRLKIGTTQSEAQAESMLASVGIAPKNGWIADYPVTPDIVGELEKAVSEAADAKRLPIAKNDALKIFRTTAVELELPIIAEVPEQYAEGPPPTTPQYYEPSVIDDYYYDQGPPIVTYYPPPWDYYYLYAWVPYPFWYSGFWFPGFFCLHDFHRSVFVNGSGRFISNHFWDSRTRGFGRIDPAARHMGNAVANISHPASRFSSQPARNGASSILSRSSAHTALNRPTGGISSNRGNGGLSNFRGGVSSIRPPTGYRSPSTGYPSGRGVPFGRPSYGSSFNHWGSYSHSGMGAGRSFSSLSRSASPGFRSGGFGSRGFSGGGARGSGRGGGGGHRHG